MNIGGFPVGVPDNMVVVSVVKRGKKNGVHDCEDSKGEGGADQDELEPRI